MSCDHHGRAWPQRPTAAEDWTRDLPERFRLQADAPCRFERFDDAGSGAWRVVGRDAAGEICYQRTVYSREFVAADDEHELALVPEYVQLGWSWRLRGGRWLSVVRERAGAGDCRRDQVRHSVTPQRPR